MKDAQEQLAFETRERAESDLGESQERLRKIIESYKLSPAAKADMKERSDDFIKKAWHFCITHIEWERSRDAIWKEKIESSAKESVKYLKIVAWSTLFAAIFTAVIAFAAVVEAIDFVFSFLGLG